MLEIPTSDWQETSSKHVLNLPTQDWQNTEQAIHHRFTHIDLRLDIVRAKAAQETSLEDYGTESRWYPLADLSQLGLPSLMKKIVGAMDNNKVKSHHVDE